MSPQVTTQYTETPPQNPSTTDQVGKILSDNLTGEVVLLLSIAGVAVFRQVLFPALKRWTNRALGKRAYVYDIRIQQTLAECVGRTKACRALLYEFHNGAKLSSGRHYERVSITNQYCQKGSSLIKEIRDMPVSIVSSLLGELDKAAEQQDIPFIARVLDTTDNHSMLMRAYGVHSTIAFLLLDEKKHVGIIELQFDEPVENLSKEVNELHPLVAQVMFELRQAAASYSLWRSLGDLLAK